MVRSLALVACVAVVGCSSGGADAGNTLAFDAFCTNYLDAVAGQVATCNSGPKELWSKALRNLVSCSDLGKAVDAGRVGYDPAFGQACITTAAGFSCAALLDSAAAPDCLKALNGKVAVGSTCYGGADCGEGKYCSKATPTACSGTCKTQIAAGAACGIADDCVRGYFCSNSVCTLDPPQGSADVGASCSGGIKCKPGLACDRITSNCTKPIKESQPCQFGHGTCEFFTSCSSANSCVRFSSAGGPCGTKQAADGGTDYETSSCVDSYCKTNTGSAAGTCVVLLADNAVCATNAECLSGDCTASKCAPRCVVP